jgi:integral membrane sensor domain MASE1
MALLLGATAWLSLSLARVPDGVAAVWITNGIWAGWLLSRRTASWPGYLAAGYLSQLAVHFQVGDDWIPGAALSAFNLLEVLIIAGAIRCVIPDVSNPRSWLGLGSVATASTLVACASPA